MSVCLWIDANTALETGKQHRLACTHISFQKEIKKQSSFLETDLWTQDFLLPAPVDTSAF